MVSIEDTLSDPVELCYGVPHGSVLGPLLFILYTQPLTHVILTHTASDMLFPDDTHVNKSCNVNDMDSVILYVEKCVSDITTWMLSNKLQMNEDKTEVLLVTPNELLNFAPSLRNLGVTLDSTLSLYQHILNICRGAFLEL